MRVLKIALAFVALGSVPHLYAQEFVTTLSADNGGDTVRKGDKIVLIESYPQFSGNLKLWLQSQMSNRRLGKKAKHDGSRCEIGFIINEQGGIDSIHVKTASGLRNLNKEGLRVIQMMSQGQYWTPGTQNGKPVRVKMTIPFIYHAN